MRYAIIENGVVVNVVEAPEPMAGKEMVATLEAGIGWTWSNGEFTRPSLPPAAPIRRIRTLAFRRRLPVEARRALTVAASAALDGGDATLQTWLDDLAASREVDLDDPEVADGVAALVAAGLISAGQAQTLLADGEPVEAAG